MKILAKPLTTVLYKAYLRSRLDRYPPCATCKGLPPSAKTTCTPSASCTAK